MKKTLKEINEFRATATNLLRFKKEKETPEDLKLKYALSKVVQRTESIVEKASDKLQEKRIDLCKLDDEGCIIETEKGGFKYSRENRKKLESYFKDLDKKEHEIKPHFVKIPKDFPFITAFKLEGFVFETVEEPGDEK